jgi:hypothetical protein
MVTVVLSTLFALSQAPDADTKYLKEKGISIQKPAKKDEWQFKDSGKLTRSQIVLTNVVDDVSIEIYSEELDTDKVNYDPKYTLEQHWKLRSADGQYKEPKQVGKITATNFPGRAATGVRVWLLDQTMKLADGTGIEWKEYCFIGHENRSGYIVNVISKAGMYEKYKKDIELILSSIKTYKLPKK